MTQQSSKRRSERRKANDRNIVAMIFGPVGVTAVLVVIISALWARDRASQVPFEPDTEAGQAALVTVETAPDRGREHVNPGQPVNYEEDFPTSGPHDPVHVMQLSITQKCVGVLLGGGLRGVRPKCIVSLPRPLSGYSWYGSIPTISFATDGLSLGLYGLY